MEIFRPVVRELCQLELLTEEEGVVRLTRRGMLFSNDVFARFLAVEEPELQRNEDGGKSVNQDPALAGNNRP